MVAWIKSKDINKDRLTVSQEIIQIWPKAVSAAQAIHAAGYGGADMVYLTGQAWDDDVKQFQISKYGHE